MPFHVSKRTIICLVFLLFSLLILSTEQTLACAYQEAPQNDGRSQWYCANNSSTVVVFVHGLNAGNRTTWRHADTDGKSGAYWPDLVLQDSLVAAATDEGVAPSILLAGYHTGPGSRHFRMADAQAQLSDAIFTSINGQPPAIEKQTIIFVGHSLGGVLVRDLLSRHAQRFQGKRLGLLLVGSPSKGSSFANIASLAQWAIDNQMVRELEQGSDYLEEVHTRFRRAISAEGDLHFIVGRELYEHYGILEAQARCNANTLTITAVVCAVGQRLASYVEGGPVVPKESAVVYWPELAELIPQSDHLSIVKPSDLGHPTQLALRELVKATNQAAAAPCLPPRDLGFTFNIQPQLHVNRRGNLTGRVERFDFVHLSVLNGEPLRPTLPLAFDNLTKLHQLRLAEPPFPCHGELFWAKLKPRVETSQKITSGSQSTDLCVRRSGQKAPNTTLFLDCIKGQSCRISEPQGDFLEVCRSSDQTNVMRASLSQTTVAHWTGPSLATLNDMPPSTRPGYTEFHVISEPLSYMSTATSFGYGVYVNGVPVHIDGNPPFLIRTPISEGSRIHLTFPIENLGFRGGKNGDGYENVEVRVRFFERQRIVGTARLERRYVAYRHAPVKRETDLETGETFSWRAIYRPATSGENFEVVLEHGASSQWMTDRRVEFDQLEKTLMGRRAIGVLRPGRRENRRIGMIIGLVEETGQVRSLFTRQQAEQICRWVMRQQDLSGLHKIGSFIFEFPKETFDATRDRGRSVALCQEV